MNKLLKYLFYFLLVSLIAGPSGAIPLGIAQVNIYFTDIVIGLMGLIWLTRLKDSIKLVRTDKIAIYFCIFVSIAIISLMFSPISLNINERFISGLYIIRLFAYFFTYITVKQLIKTKTISISTIEKLLIASGLILTALGWIQYFIYPDLRNLYYLGWDPHFKRIFSTYLDPNYFGLMMVLVLIASLLKKLTRQSVLIFITLMFTYSRSSFLALIGAATYFSIAKKKVKLLSGSLLLILVSVLLLPRPGGAGVQLERVFSIETRIENWQQAFKFFADHPILGVGFNSIRYAKSQYNFGQDNLAESHAGAGFDNSFLFILATTGILGLLFYLSFLRQIKRKENLWVKSSIVAIIIHSFFLNSLFLPWVMVWMWMILGVNNSHSEA